MEGWLLQKIDVVYGECQLFCVMSVFQLVLVARDHATPNWYEALQFLTIVLKDVDDNVPEFPAESNGTYTFHVMENTPSHRRIGKFEVFCSSNILKYVLLSCIFSIN